MPLYIRHLPGQPAKLVDDKAIPPNNVLYNPSIAWPILYIRKTEYHQTKQVNGILLHNMETNKSYTISSPMHLLEKNINTYTGLEDLRICWYKERLWFTATCTHASSNMISELCVGYFNKEFTKVERMSHVDIGSVPVKNVCPFVVGEELLLFDIYKSAIYTCTDVYDTTDSVNPTWLKFIATKIKSLIAAPGLSIDMYRGSTSPVHLHGNTWGVIVHDIIFNDHSAPIVQRLSYLHIWMEFDITTGVVTFVSTPFWLVQWGIEYVSGFMMKNNVVTIFLGINDKAALSFTTTINDLRVGK